MLLAGCGGDDPKGSGEPAPDRTTTTEAAEARAADVSGDWTVLVYMAADNNLEEPALDDLAEMTEAEGTDFVVLVDRSPGYTDADAIGLGDFDDSRLLHIKDGEVEVIGEPGELNTGDPSVLASFVNEGINAYPNDHYALTIWNHGGGWKGAAWDDTDDEDHLELTEIAEAVEVGLEETDRDQLDLIGFDACLMATYEVGDLLAPVATYMIASEDLEPGFGWDWSAVSTDGGATTAELGESIIDGFAAASAEEGENATTLSLTDLTALEALDEAVATVAEAMSEDAAKAVGRVGYSRNNSLGFARDPNPQYDYFLVDLGDLGRALATVDGMEDAGEALTEAVERVVVHHGDGPAAAAATGLTAHFPPTRELASAEYEALDATSSWTDFLGAYYDAAESLEVEDLPLFVDPDRYIEEGEAVTTVDGVRLSADVLPGTGGNLADARLYWGEVPVDDTDWVVFFGERNAEVDGDTISADYDWRYLTITAPEGESVAYAKLEVDADGEITRIAVPLAYHRGDATAPGSLYITLDGGTVTAETFYVRSGADAISAIRPEPGDTFTPMLKRQHLTDMSVEWIPATDVPLTAITSSLQYRYGTLPAARAIMVSLGMTDVVGTVDSVYHGTATPAELDGE